MILAALVAVASLSANAQIWVGGEVGFTADKTTKNGNKVGNASYFNFIPEVGYTLNDKFDVALAIGLSHYNGNGNTAGLNNNDIAVYNMGNSVNRNTFKLNPYVRYKFAKAGDFTFFVDGGFAFYMIHNNQYQVGGETKNANAWDLAIKPGVAYNISDKVSLVAHIGKLGYQAGKWDDYKTNTFNMGVSGNDLTFGAYVSF